MKNFFRKIALGIRGNAANISLGVIVFGFIGMFGLLAFQQQKIEQGNEQNLQILTQLTSITSRLEKGAATRTDQFNELNKHMDCIVEFFTQPDRTNKSITDINTCELASKTGETTTLPKSSANTNTTPQSTDNGAVSQPENQSIITAPTAPKQSIIDVLLMPIKKLLGR